MNYLAEIKAFYDWLETNKLPTSSIALWHALMHIANKTGWQDNFAVAVSVLEIKTGLNAKTIQRARNTLKTAGRIEFTSRGGNQSALYTMISLVGHNDPQSVPQDVPQSVPQSVPQNVPQSVHINKLNKTKQKQCANALFEELWSAYPNKKGKGQVSDAKKLALLSVGREEMLRAIRRYLADLKKDEWRKPQNGSTFFNSGYVDYLDENYQADQKSSYEGVPSL